LSLTENQFCGMCQVIPQWVTYGRVLAVPAAVKVGAVKVIWEKE